MHLVPNLTVQQRVITILILVSCCVSCDFSTTNSSESRQALRESAHASKSLAGKFESISKKAIADGMAVGIQFALIENKRPPLVRAYGLADREQQVPMTTRTPINVASISKSVTAWGALAMLERKSLPLSSSVKDLLADASLYEALYFGSDVTVGMLLSHTSGLSGASVPVTPATEPLPDVKDVLLGRSTVPRALLTQKPGVRFQYSGAGFLVLQLIIERQTASKFADYMSTSVLTPAAMNGSTFALNPNMLGESAAYYRSDGRRREPYHLPGAAGALYSNAEDMAGLLGLYLERGKETRATIVSEAGFTLLSNYPADGTALDPSSGEATYTLGHYTYRTPEDVTIIYHQGGNPGLRAIYILAVERDTGFFAVANSDRSEPALAALLDAWGDHHKLTLSELR